MTTMNKYDLTVLVKKSEGMEEKMEKLVKAMGGTLGRMIEMGRKQLAYPIKKASEAEFLNWSLELPSQGVVQLGKKLTVDREVIRHLLVKTDK